MIEIRFHGRGGQGTVVASQMLAVAAYKAGYMVQSFPQFGVERRGAPVKAFMRLTKDPDEIMVRTGIYTPDIVVILDPSLLATEPVTEGLKEGGWIVINIKSPDLIPNFEELNTHYNIAVSDANSIAIKYRLGTKMQPIVNTCILGALVRATDLVPLDILLETIEAEAPVKGKENAMAAEEAYRTVQLIRKGSKAAMKV